MARQEDTALVTLADALQMAEHRLATAAVPSAALDARVLLRHVLGVTAVALLLRLADPLPPAALDQYEALVERRSEGEPLAYLTGEREFYGLSLRVTPAVLIPRPETELLVERAVALLPAGARAVDVGTGSGAIAVALAVSRPDVTIVALDRSLAACQVARENAQRHGVAGRVAILCASLLDALNDVIDAVIANVPYVPEGEVAGLQREVGREPQLALVGGPDGLDLYRQLLADIGRRRRQPAVVLCEHGALQGDAMLALAHQYLSSYRATVLPDLAGWPRLLEAVT